ncbi:MAG: inositol monophosphatase [Spirochaetaceae bacterium]|nr:MAG: inositol monophosphatase [Spirochaetaceae bacterium]
MNNTNQTSEDFLHLVETTARQAAKTAGAIALKYLNESSPQEKGASNNMVTRADIEAQQAIADCIRGTFPEHSFLGEEGDKDAAVEAALKAEHLWVVDPIDGTNNYAQGIPFFCVSIAYLSHGVPRFGLVYDPSREELFCARKGGGAYLNDKAIRVSQASGIDGAIVATGFAYERGEYVRRTLRTIQALFDHKLRGIRRFGACAIDLCWTAAGRLDGYFELKLEPWDYAAGMLIVAEAGGRVSDAEGESLAIGAPAVVASAPGMHDALLKIIDEAQ